MLLLLVLQLVLQLLEGTCVVTPLPTDSAKIRGAGKSETKRAMTYLEQVSKFSFFLFLFFALSHAQKRRLKTLEVVE